MKKFTVTVRAEGMKPEKFPALGESVAAVFDAAKERFGWISSVVVIPA